MFPMKPQINPWSIPDHRPNITFDPNNVAGFQGFNTEKDFNRTSRNPDLNTAEIIYKTYTKMGTPEFWDSIDTEANHRSILEYDVDEDEQIDMLLNQVSTLDLNIFNSVYLTTIYKIFN